MSNAVDLLASVKEADATSLLSGGCPECNAVENKLKNSEVLLNSVLPRHINQTLSLKREGLVYY